MGYLLGGAGFLTPPATFLMGLKKITLEKPTRFGNALRFNKYGYRLMARTKGKIPRTRCDEKELLIYTNLSFGCLSGFS
ncbi:MAG: hypothetical protein DRR19_06065 [Candidatus Parabeggiatoa sp. nov. 1]|nr:MAG: hypothetical protein DRR19_06065 [Gammaproteobacteria bacterium]